MGFLLSCDGSNNQTEKTSPGSDNLVINISEDQAKAIGLEFGKLKKLLLSSAVISNGYLDTPPQYKAKISSIVSGKIVKVNYLVGDYVRRGSEIIRLESIEFLEIQKNYIAVKSNLKYLEDDYLRQKKLSEENVSAKKLFYQSEKDYFTALAEFEFINKKLDILNVSKEEIEKGNITPYLSIQSTINGYITGINTVLGEFVSAEDVMVELIDPRHLHAELNVYEKNVLKIKKGQKVEISTKIDTMSFTGKVFLIGKELDEDSRSIPVHVHIPENKNLLPGMFIEGKILLGERNVLAIPETGLLREEERSYIFVLLEHVNNNYVIKKVVVKTMEEKNDMVAIEFPGTMDTSRMVAIKGVYYLSSVTN
jgi:cobalt-zinc-cadmium efflux system membrane fusion protein